MALFMCSLHPAMSFCDIEDFAEVISCIPIILFSPSGIFISMASALCRLNLVMYNCKEVNFQWLVSGNVRNSKLNETANSMQRTRRINIVNVIGNNLQLLGL